MSNKIAVIILTYNEEAHIERCISSVKKFTDEIFVVDSFSNDNTVDLAKSLGAKVYQNEWVNYANQFNWALKNCPIISEWVWRLDADEYIDREKGIGIKQRLKDLDNDINGLYIKRKIIFLGREILHGGWYPVWHLKIWRNNKGYCEARWMDEHIKLKEGKTGKLSGYIQVDENLNDLTWWTRKHNSYATREMVDMLDSQFGIFKKSEVTPKFFGNSEERKRWLKKKYLGFPLFIRPFFYFVYRYIILGGFLDGKQGFIWHVLQGFWYRFLVDAKIFELKRRFNGDNEKIIGFLREKYTM